MSDTPAAAPPKKKPIVGSFIQYQCPVSAKITKVPLSEVPVGLFVEVEDPEEDEDHPPVGCGRIIIEVMQVNPAVAEVRAEIEEVKAQRAAALQDYLRNVQGQILAGLGDLDEVEGMSAEDRAEVEGGRAKLTESDLAQLRAAQAGLQDGSLARMVRKRLKRDLPLPVEPDNKNVFYRLDLNGIKMEHLMNGIKALQGVGYPIREIGEEEEAES